MRARSDRDTRTQAVTREQARQEITCAGADYGLTVAAFQAGTNTQDVPDTGRMLPENVGVDPEGYSGVGVAEPGGDQVDGDSRQQQCGRV
jgi:hypothetical protein